MNTNLIMGLLTQLVAALTPVPAREPAILLSTNTVWVSVKTYETGPTNSSTDETIRVWAKSGDICRVLDHNWVPGIRVGDAVVVNTLEHFPKRGSRRERGRLESVCIAAVGFLSELEEPPPYVLTRASVDYTIGRCKSAVNTSRQTK